MSKSVINVQQIRKDRYLSNLIEWMANHPRLDEIFNSSESELHKDFQILRFLLESEKFHLEVTKNEIFGAFREAKLKSSKSRFLCEKHRQNAQKYIENHYYEEAAQAFAKAIVYQPLENQNDYQMLADLYLGRARCFLQMHDDEAAVVDLEFAQTADSQYAWSQMFEEEREIHQRYKNSLLLSLCGDSGPRTKIHDSFQVVKSQQNSNKTYSLVPKSNVEGNTTVWYERPIAKFSCKTFDNCARCDKYLRNFLYWPCEFCADIVFCTKECYEKDFEYHKFECGLTRYASQIPIMIIMLRFYVRTKSSPILQCPIHVDFVKQYLDSLMMTMTKQKEQQNDLQPYLLNVFRQCMDQHPKRNDLARNKRYYYACLIMSIEFTHLYDVCIHNGQIVQQQRSSLTKNNMMISLEMTNNSYVHFEWAKEIDSQIELIILVFRDMKRFMASPFSKFEMQPRNFRQNYRKERRLLLLSGILFPQQHLVLTNLEPVFHKQNGLIEIRTSKIVAEGEELLLNKNMVVAF